MTRLEALQLAASGFFVAQHQAEDLLVMIQARKLSRLEYR